MTTPDSSVSPPDAGAQAAAQAAVWPQTLVGAGVLLTGLALAFGAIGISSEAGYGGVGPNFLPWLVSVVLVLCGAWILWEARTGGFRELDPPTGADRAYWPGFVWVSAGLLLNAALITTLGFILSCTLCYLLAVQGLRRASGQAGVNAPRTWVIDFVTGVLIAAPVFWMFTQFLAINLPGLTSTGWL
ncbi:putative tricarboxylic transport membrane protein [Variovorax boronicumulans]|jgi:putative tricarboxylic transport membrane protein|uniref:tripartite tricarboxylate transporter TctB family protein n=1 Tax=Variovorax TaxID=34072 RepID=UPI0027809B4E|nr:MULTISPECIES: tripartite tricarboxylate transporter TctB family protein [Variovorax]MDP9993382.1 putative tricarboxylic transport membrane protein [Variovorax boronicumulans]MDQ0004751.1 putative tricarboxylic transport membrane protein [Variovorax boronicumulans]MDQ0034813.1 putative tricarboxylic transport membrane protein [Variovorax boronicumulans]MDQ0608824.1 putative tricarboxylic transport membrane protein [Variovorax sp. W1I1]